LGGAEWGGIKTRIEEVEDEKRLEVEELGCLMGQCELERPGAKVEELGRLLKKVVL